MIDEQFEEQAASYVLGALEPNESAAFEARLAGDQELRGFVDDLRATAAQMAHGAPLRTPPAHLEREILRALQSESRSTGSASQINWIPWALAAGLAISSAWLLVDRARVREQLERTTSHYADLEKRDADAQSKMTSVTAEREQMSREITKLKERDSLSQMQIATLTSKLQDAPRATAFVIWDAEKQRGVLTAVDVPPNAADHDYQLWVVDPKYQIPVDAGVFSVRGGGATKIAFKPKLPVSSANAFAVSLERKGGVPKAEGPMVLVGK